MPYSVAPAKERAPPEEAAPQHGVMYRQQLPLMWMFLGCAQWGVHRQVVRCRLYHNLLYHPLQGRAAASAPLTTPFAKDAKEAPLRAEYLRNSHELPTKPNSARRSHVRRDEMEWGKGGKLRN